MLEIDIFLYRTLVMQETRGVSSINWTAPPLESQLADFTLWPGMQSCFFNFVILKTS